MSTLRLGDETVDLGRRILVVDASDESIGTQLIAAGVLDAGPPTVAALRGLPERLERGETVAMTFSHGQLPELALAVVRGCRIVRAEDVAAATKVCRMVDALFEASASEAP